MTISPLGVLAGHGVYPKLLLDNIAKTGIPVVVAGLAGQIETALFQKATAVEIFPIGAISRTARFFRQSGVSRIFFAGGIRRLGAWKHSSPDRFGLRLLFSALTTGDDTLLKKTAQIFETFGITVADPAAFTKEMLAPAGHLSGPPPNRELLSDIVTGFKAARNLGKKDKGQAVIVKNGCLIAEEGKGGTDNLIENAHAEGGVLVKAVKPGQDRRFDLPAIGPETIIQCKRHGIIAVGLHANGVLMLGQSEVISLSNRCGITLVGIPK